MYFEYNPLEPVSKVAPKLYNYGIYLMEVL
jgi:hypothetical protein